jgi:hypothetical protein
LADFDELSRVVFRQHRSYSTDSARAERFLVRLEKERSALAYIDGVPSIAAAYHGTWAGRTMPRNNHTSYPELTLFNGGAQHRDSSTSSGNAVLRIAAKYK